MCHYFIETQQMFIITGHSFFYHEIGIFPLSSLLKKMAEPILPSDWKAVIKNAKLYRPFMIIEMDQADIKDLDILS